MILCPADGECSLSCLQSIKLTTPFFFAIMICSHWVAAFEDAHSDALLIFAIDTCGFPSRVVDMQEFSVCHLRASLLLKEMIISPRPKKHSYANPWFERSFTIILDQLWALYVVPSHQHCMLDFHSRKSAASVLHHPSTLCVRFPVEIEPWFLSIVFRMWSP